jgi:mono/diheme cytochrome c family protein
MTKKQLYLAITFGFTMLVFGVPRLSAWADQDKERAASRHIDFVREIRPIFERVCYSCHGAATQMSGLRLDAKKPAFAGGQSGRIIIAGRATASPLYQRIAGLGDLTRMPMNRPAACLSLSRAI